MRQRSASPLARRLRLEPLEDRRLLTLALPGDYNVDASVDAADYVVWRNTLGTVGVPAFTLADGDGDTTIDQDDFNLWRANFGNHAPTDANEAFSVQPNVGIIVNAANGLLIGATDPDAGDVVGLAPTSVGTFATTAGGSITIAADGSFTYNPQAGDRSLADTFVYSVRDNHGATDTSTVTFNLNGDVIWFVDLSAAAGGSGTVASPYNSLLSLDDSGANPDQTGDTIFLFRTTAGAVSHDLGAQDFDFQASQLLIGEGISGAVGDDINDVRGFTTQAHSRVLPAINGEQHTIVANNSNAVTLNTGNTLRGLDVGSTGTGTKIVGSGFGTFALNDVGLSGTGGALNLTNGTIQGLTGGSTAVFNDLSSTSSVNAIAMTTVAGNLSGPAGSSIAGATGATIVVSGGTVSFTYSGNVTQANNAALLDVNGGHTNGTITFNTGTLSATNGNGLQFNNADSTTSYNFNGTTTLNGGDAGVDIFGGSGGTFTFGANTSINNPTGIAYREDTSTANVTFNGTITKTNNANNVVDINAKTGGTTTFNGQINASTTTAVAVDLTGNTGGTINFIPGGNGLDIATTSGIGFNATGGGTVTVQGSGNSISSTTGTALNVVSTTIGGSGLNFRSIAANGSISGIILSSTGAGGLTVSGDGGVTNNGSGGVIQNATGPGISLTSTGPISLGYMNVQNGGDDGIRGSSVTGFSLSRSNVTANGNAVGEAGLDFSGLFGTASITNSTVSGSAEDNVVIRNTSGNLASLTVRGSTFSSNSSIGNDGFLIEAGGTSTMAVDIQNSNFSANRGDHFQAAALNSGSMNVLFKDNTLTGGHATALGQGITINAATGVAFGGYTGTINYDIDNNTINGAISNSITVNLGTSGAAARFNGFIRNNDIGTAGVSHSGSLQANGIALDVHGNGTHTVAVTGNIVHQAFDRGLFVLGNDGNEYVMNLTVEGNTLNVVPNDVNGSRESFHVNWGATSTNVFGGVDSGTLRLDFGGPGAEANTITHGIGAPDDFRIRQRFDTRIELEGYAGGAFDTAAVVAYVQGRNTGSAGEPGSASANNSAAVADDGFHNVANVPLPTAFLVAVQGGVETTGIDLTAAELSRVAAVAIERLAAAGASATQLDLLNSVSFQIVDLAGAQLGTAAAGVVQIDINGADWGYFVDDSPLDDSEFALLAANGSRLADADSDAYGRIDLLSVVLHEMGHVLGYDHDDEGVMGATLETGVRHTDLDALFADEMALATLFS